MNCNTTHYRANSSSVPGDPTVYNLLRYRRLAPQANYNRAGATRKLLTGCGIDVQVTEGVGGTHLILADWLSHGLALSLGDAHRGPALRWLAEQFLLAGRRR